MLHAFVDPLTAFRDYVDKPLHDITVILDHVLVYGEHARDEIWPHIFRQPKDTAITIEFGLAHERFAARNRVHGFGVQRRRHIGRWHFDELDIFDRHVRLLERAEN